MTFSTPLITQNWLIFSQLKKEIEEYKKNYSTLIFHRQLVVFSCVSYNFTVFDSFFTCSLYQTTHSFTNSNLLLSNLVLSKQMIFHSIFLLQMLYTTLILLTHRPPVYLNTIRTRTRTITNARTTRTTPPLN